MDEILFSILAWVGAEDISYNPITRQILKVGLALIDTFVTGQIRHNEAIDMYALKFDSQSSRRNGSSSDSSEEKSWTQ